MTFLARVAPIGQYINTRSVIHRLDPRIKLVALVALIVVTTLCSSFTALAALVIFALFILALSRISPIVIARNMRFAVLFLLYFYVLQTLLYASRVAHPYVYWHWWLLSVTREGLLSTAFLDARALLIFFLVNLLLLTTTVVDVTDGVESLLSPLQRIGIPVQETTLVMVVALKFVPIFFGELGRLIKARTARGVAIDSGNIFQRAFNIVPVIIPLIVGGLRRAETLAVAMEARGYRGGKGRTKLHQLRYGWRDLVAFLLLVGVCAEVLLLNARVII
jgi:energy-coupling factor transport system permease protein